MEKKREEDLSPEELHARIEEDKKKLVRSGVLAFSALVAIIVLCIAWFVSNNKVSLTSGTISADIQVPFELASVGSRQSPEEEYLKLTEGVKKNYDIYYDTNLGEEVSTQQTYYVGTSGLAWHLNGQRSFFPGVNGKLELYLIPKTSGLKTATIELKLEARDKDGKEISDDSLKNLIDGHILLFADRDEDNCYQGWLDNKTLTVKLKNDQTFQQDHPYKVTIRWVWPQYLRNYIYTETIEGDLFTSIANESYTNLLKFVNENHDKLFCNYGTNTIDHIDQNISGATLDIYSGYYNQADEYIGSNAKYIYVSATVQ